MKGSLKFAVAVSACATSVTLVLPSAAVAIPNVPLPDPADAMNVARKGSSQVEGLLGNLNIPQGDSANLDILGNGVAVLKDAADRLSGIFTIGQDGSSAPDLLRDFNVDSLTRGSSGDQGSGSDSLGSSGDSKSVLESLRQGVYGSSGYPRETGSGAKNVPTASAVPSAAPAAGLDRGEVCEGGTFKVTSAPAYVKQNDNGTLTIDTSQAKAGESFTLKGVYTEPTSSTPSQVAEPSAVRENHSARGSSGSSGSSGVGSSGTSSSSPAPSAQAGPDSAAVAGQGCSGRSVPVALDVNVGEAPAGHAGASQAAGAPGASTEARNQVSYPPVRVAQGGSATSKPEGEIAPYNATRAANTYPWVSVATDGTVTASPGRDVTPGTYKVPVALTDTAGNVVSMAEVAVEVTGDASKENRPAGDGDSGASDEVTAAQPSMTVTENQRVIDPNEQKGPAGDEAAESSAVAAPRPGGNGDAASQGSGNAGGAKNTPAGGKVSTARSNQSLPVTGSPIRLLAAGGMIAGLAAVVLVLWGSRKRHET